MKIQYIIGFGNNSVNNTLNEKREIKRYCEPRTGAYFYYDVKTGENVPCDIFCKTIQKSIEKQQKKQSLYDKIADFFDTYK